MPTTIVTQHQSYFCFVVGSNLDRHLLALNDIKEVWPLGQYFSWLQQENSMVLFVALYTRDKRICEKLNSRRDVSIESKGIRKGRKHKKATYDRNMSKKNDKKTAPHLLHDIFSVLTV